MNVRRARIGGGHRAAVRAPETPEVDLYSTEEENVGVARPNGSRSPDCRGHQSYKRHQHKSEDKRNQERRDQESNEKPSHQRRPFSARLAPHPAPRSRASAPTPSRWRSSASAPSRSCKTSRASRARRSA